jgi:transposase
MVDFKSGFEIEVLSAADAVRRRPWGDPDKLRIVEASFSAPRLVSATARAHGISRSLLTTWRRLAREGKLGVQPAPSFAPVMLTPEAAPRTHPASSAERIEIVLVNGRRLIVDAGIDAEALARVIAVRERA